MSAPIEVCFVLSAGSLILDWAGPAEALRMANLELADAPPFRLRFLAPAASVESSVGAWISQLEPLPEALPTPSWVVIVGKTILADTRTDARQTAEVIDWLRRIRPGQPGKRLVTVCSGTLLAAQAGLLDQRRVTTHHLDLDTLAELAPRAQVIPDRVFVQDGEIWSSAGVTAGIDLALHLISTHCGPVVAARVAQRLALALRRGPDDPQLSPFLAHRQHFNARLHRVQDAVSRSPRDAWDAPRMAEVASTTVRTLNRLFQEHTGITPLAYLRDIRLAVARSVLDAGGAVARAAELAGFSSDLQLRRAWRSGGLGGAPSDERRRLSRSLSQGARHG